MSMWVGYLWQHGCISPSHSVAASSVVFSGVCLWRRAHTARDCAQTSPTRTDGRVGTVMPVRCLLRGGLHTDAVSCCSRRYERKVAAAKRKAIAKEMDYTDSFVKVKKKRCMDGLKKKVLETYKASESR